MESKRVPCAPLVNNDPGMMSLSYPRFEVTWPPNPAKKDPRHAPHECTVLEY